MTPKEETLTLKGLTPDQRKRVERALRAPRDKKFSLMFRDHDIAKWRQAAEHAGEARLSDWMERVLNEAARGELGSK